MKTPVPVSLDDLRATAKDDKHGEAFYGYLKVYQDDATNSFNYYLRGAPINEAVANEYLKYLGEKKK